MSIYWAHFPSHYLRTIHSIGMDKLSSDTRIPLRHTIAYNLLDPISRTEFLKQFIALIKVLVGGYGNVGHLRLPGTKIHRGLESEADEEKNAPEWMVLDYQENEQWIKNYETQYES